MEPRKLFTERKPRRSTHLFTPGTAVPRSSRKSTSKPDSKKFAFLAEQLGEYRSTIRQLRRELDQAKLCKVTSGQNDTPSYPDEIDELKKELQRERQARLEAEKQVARQLGQQVAEYAAREALYQNRQAQRLDSLYEKKVCVTSREYYEMVEKALHRKAAIRAAERARKQEVAKQQRRLSADMIQGLNTPDGAAGAGQNEFSTPWHGDKAAHRGDVAAAGCTPPGHPALKATPDGSFSQRSQAKGHQLRVEPEPMLLSSLVDVRPARHRDGSGGAHPGAQSSTPMASGPPAKAPVTPGVFFRALAREGTAGGVDRAAVAKAVARGDRGAVEAMALESIPGNKEGPATAGRSVQEAAAREKGAAYSRLSKRVADACRALDYKGLNAAFEEAERVFGPASGDGHAWLCRLADGDLVLRTGPGAGASTGSGGRRRAVPVLVFVAGASGGGVGAQLSKRCCRALLRNHANINAMDAQGRTAVDAAREAGNTGLVAYLGSKGGMGGEQARAATSDDVAAAPADRAQTMDLATDSEHHHQQQQQQQRARPRTTDVVRLEATGPASNRRGTARMDSPVAKAPPIGLMPPAVSSYGHGSGSSRPARAPRGRASPASPGALLLAGEGASQAGAGAVVTVTPSFKTKRVAFDLAPVQDPAKGVASPFKRATLDSRLSRSVPRNSRSGAGSPLVSRSGNLSAPGSEAGKGKLARAVGSLMGRGDAGQGSPASGRGAGSGFGGAVGSPIAGAVAQAGAGARSSGKRFGRKRVPGVRSPLARGQSRRVAGLRGGRGMGGGSSPTIRL